MGTTHSPLHALSHKANKVSARMRVELIIFGDN